MSPHAILNSINKVEALMPKTNNTLLFPTVFNNGPADLDVSQMLQLRINKNTVSGH